MLDEADRLMATDPEPKSYFSRRILVRLLRGEPAAALKQIEAVEADPSPVRFRVGAMVLHDLGRSAEASAQLEELKRQKPTYGHALGVAQAYAWMGERDLAVDWAEKQLELATPAGYIYFFVLADPILRRKLDGFARWDELQRRYGVAPDQVARIDFAPVLPKPRVADGRHQTAAR